MDRYNYNFPNGSDLGVMTNFNQQDIQDYEYPSQNFGVSYASYNMGMNYSTQNTYNFISIETKPEQRNDDELWIETWLSTLGKIHINLDSTVDMKVLSSTHKSEKPQRTVSIHSAKFNLKNGLQIINKLKELRNDLEENISSMSTIEWQKRTIEIGALKDEFSSLMCQFRNADVLSSLSKALRNRKRKRNSQKKRKQERQYRVLLQKEKNKKLHEDIDQWLLNMKEAGERVKLEETLRKDADCVLSEVTKKKSDARKQLSLLPALIKLRNVREQQAVQRGEKTSIEDSRAFKHVTERLVKMWENAMQVYSKEEQGLRTMLEQNAAEDSNVAKLEKERKITREWDSILFGPKCVPTQAFWGLTLAEKNFETFVAIRKSWDTFLVSNNSQMGSKIPIGWVLPNANADETWKKFLQHS